MIDELIERVRGLTGPDRGVDYDLWASVDPFGVAETSKTENLQMPWRQWRELHIGDKPECIYGKPVNHQAFTASLDAAVALVERVLPGWGFYLRSDKEGHGCGLVYPDAFRVTPCHCMGATPAIAVILALLSALKAKEARE